MPKIRIEATDTLGARLWMDDQEVKDLRHVTVRIPLDDVAVVSAEVVVTDKFELVAEEGTALFLGLKVMPGYELVSEQVSDKRTIFRSQPETTTGTKH